MRLRPALTTLPFSLAIVGAMPSLPVSVAEGASKPAPPSILVPNQLQFTVGSKAWNSVFANLPRDPNLEEVLPKLENACNTLFKPIWDNYGPPKDCGNWATDQYASGVCIMILLIRVLQS